MPDKKQLKVLMIDSETTWRGGEGQLLLLMKGLQGSEFEVTLAAPPNAAITERAGDCGIECLPLPIAGGMDLVAAWTLRRYLRDHGFDIVHCHSSHAHSIAFVAQGTKLLRGVRPMRGRAAVVVSRRVDFDVATNKFSSMKYRHGADIFLAISNGV